MAIIPFDDRDGEIWLDGEFVPWRDAKIHILSHGLHYGSCVFEGERVYEHEIFKSKEHTDRLFKSAELLSMDVPFTKEEIEAAKAETARRAGYKDAYVRPVIWRGAGSMGVSAPASGVRCAIAVWEWPSFFPPELLENGVKMEIARWRRPGPMAAPCTAKAAGLYIICTLAKEEAERKGLQDALMYDMDGYIAEATGAHIFFVKDGEIHTPQLGNFIEGITRATVIDLARARGLTVHERQIKPEELGTFEQCFLTGSAAEVTPVGQIAEHTYKVGAIARQMREDYLNLVRRKYDPAAVAPMQAAAS
jgi:branched-chain amino acid aminotransferase